MKGLVIVALLLLFAFTTGCGQRYWYQESKTFDECSVDRARCRKELLRRTELRRIGEYERKFVEDCMRQKGYRLVSAKELPLGVRREDSDIPSEVPWARGAGVAGALE